MSLSFLYAATRQYNSQLFIKITHIPTSDRVRAYLQDLDTYLLQIDGSTNPSLKDQSYDDKGEGTAFRAPSLSESRRSSFKTLPPPTASSTTAMMKCARPLCFHKGTNTDAETETEKRSSTSKGSPSKGKKISLKNQLLEEVMDKSAEKIRGEAVSAGVNSAQESESEPGPKLGISIGVRLYPSLPSPTPPPPSYAFSPATTSSSSSADTSGKTIGSGSSVNSSEKSGACQELDPSETGDGLRDLRKSSGTSLIHDVI